MVIHLKYKVIHTKCKLKYITGKVIHLTRKTNIQGNTFSLLSITHKVQVNIQNM